MELRIEKRKVTDLKPLVNLSALVPFNEIKPIEVNHDNHVLTLKGSMMLASAVAKGINEVDVVVINDVPEISL